MRARTGRPARAPASPQPDSPRQQKPYLHTSPRPVWRVRRLTECFGVKTVWPAAITHKDGLRRERSPGMVEPTMSGTTRWIGKSPPRSRAGVLAARFAEALHAASPAAAVRAAPVGCGVACALRRVLARARQSLLGRHFGGDRVSTTAWRLLAQRLVPHGRHRDRRRVERGAGRLLPTGSHPGFSAAWPCGARPAHSPPRSCATSHPMPRHWPGIRRQSLPATCSAPSAAWMPTLPSCLPLPGPARSASASSVPASFSPAPISAAPARRLAAQFADLSAGSPPALPAHWRR